MLDPGLTKALDVVEDFGPGLREGAVPTAIHPLLLEDSGEALSRSIVGALTDGTHTHRVPRVREELGTVERRE